MLRGVGTKRNGRARFRKIVDLFIGGESCKEGKRGYRESDFQGERDGAYKGKETKYCPVKKTAAKRVK